MIGQMQGKFQMEVVPGVGHMLHEVCTYSLYYVNPSDATSTIDSLQPKPVQDDPSRIAEILVEFWRRNERVVVGVKKVGEL
jgi:protein phosphatase methylesterase 1